MKPDPPVGGPTPEINSPRKARAHRGMSSLYIQTLPYKQGVLAKIVTLKSIRLM